MTAGSSQTGLSAGRQSQKDEPAQRQELMSGRRRQDWSLIYRKESRD
jgi:hypothetical protein